LQHLWKVKQHELSHRPARKTEAYEHSYEVLVGEKGRLNEFGDRQKEDARDQDDSQRHPLRQNEGPQKDTQQVSCRLYAKDKSLGALINVVVVESEDQGRPKAVHADALHKASESRVQHALNAEYLRVC